MKENLHGERKSIGQNRETKKIKRIEMKRKIEQKERTSYVEKYFNFISTGRKINLVLSRLWVQ